MKLGPQFARLNTSSGRRGGSRSEPWMTTSTPTVTFHGSKSHRIKSPNPSSLRTGVARSGRGRKTH